MWKIFPTLEEAQAYAGAGTAKLPRGANDETQVWDAPRDLGDGTWAVLSHDVPSNSGVEHQVEG